MVIRGRTAGEGRGTVNDSKVEGSVCGDPPHYTVLSLLYNRSLNLLYKFRLLHELVSISVGMSLYFHQISLK